MKKTEEGISESDMQMNQTCKMGKERKGRVVRQLQTKITLETAKEFSSSLIRD